MLVTTEVTIKHVGYVARISKMIYSHKSVCCLLPQTRDAVDGNCNACREKVGTL
jgi:hypothetical protein